MVVAFATIVCVIAGATARADTTPPTGSWLWPVSGPVVRGFEPPPTRFSPGHRGIDIATDFGTPVRAPADGVVTFAGFVGGELFVTIDVGGGYLATSSWLAQRLVKRGDPVVAGEVVALSGRGHPEVDTPHLHFGTRLDGEYVDPVPLLEPRGVVDLIRLAPLENDEESGPPPEAALAVSASGPAVSIMTTAFLLRDHASSGVVWPLLGPLTRSDADSARAPPRLP